MDTCAITELQQEFIDLISEHDKQYDLRNECLLRGDESGAQALQDAMTESGNRAVKVQAEIGKLMKSDPSAT